MTKLKTGLIALLCSSALATPAIAQEQAEGANDDNIIIVTATRRAQDIQDIPIAVTAVSPVELQRQGVDNVTEITQVATSFSSSNAQTASGTVVLRIRGVGTTSNNIGFESAVGVFIDGVYQSRPGVALGEFVDVERVEVLRGPQGTLFGRNTSAGALNITNKRPDLNEFGGFANASYGNLDLVSVQGAVNVPIVKDTLAFRLTGAYRERDGFVTVVDSTGTRIGDSNGIDQFLVRGQLGFETGGGISGRLIADYSKSEAGCCTPVELLQAPSETNGLFAALGLGARGGMAAPDVATNPFDHTSAERALSNRIATASFAPTANIEQWGITGEIEVPINDNIDAIYIGSYRSYDALESYDADFSGLDAFNVERQRTRIKTTTHELRFQGDAFDGRLNWLIGGYFSDEEIDTSGGGGRGAFLGMQYDGLIGALLGGGFGPAPLTALSGGINPAGSNVTNIFLQESTSFSVFTHNELEIVDGLKLTLGLRYSDESKDASFTQPATNNTICPNLANGIATGRPPFPFLPGNALGGILIGGCFPFVAPLDLPEAFLPGITSVFLPRSFAGKFNDDELIYTAKVSYQFDAPINVYASFTHGYKSGGFNLDQTAATGGSDPRFASEEVDAYEIGLKGKFLNNAVTLNIAAFHEEFANFQVLEFTGAQFQTFNVPRAETTGVEIEALLRPSNELTINSAVTVQDARYPANCATAADALRVQNLCGNPLTNAPDIVAVFGATYERDLGDDLDFFLNGQLRAESDRRTSTQASTAPTTAAQLGNTPLLPFDVQDGTVKINLRAGIGAQDDSWAIEGFVNNLTNEVTRGVTFNTLLRTGSRSAFIQEPRTYGVTVRTKF